MTTARQLRKLGSPTVQLRLASSPNNHHRDHSLVQSSQTAMPSSMIHWRIWMLRGALGEAA